MWKSIGILLLAWIPGILAAQTAQPDNDEIMKLVNNVLKRKDVDTILSSLIENGASYAGLATLQGFDEVVRVRDRERALGQGSYEDEIQSQVNAIGSIGYVIVKTKWSGWQDDRAVGAERMNTVILVKEGKDWKIAHWHVSAGEMKYRD